VTPQGLLPLAAAGDPAQFGGKAASLSAAFVAGLPVPDGIVLHPDLVERLATEDGSGHSADANPLTWLTIHTTAWQTLLAVRSSALDEDSASSSFAGQYVTRLGVRATSGALHAAISAVHASAAAPEAHAYRYRLGLSNSRGTAVLIQPLVDATVSGVMFTLDPLTGADELVIEASWGLGEAVVGGLVTPDCFRVGPNGSVLERRPGRKSVSIVAAAGGGTEERVVEPALAHDLCLDDANLHTLRALATRCVEVFDNRALDIEWSLAGDRVNLLQCRPVTTS